MAEADFDPAWITTYGPGGSYGAVLYVEKEGFMPLFKRVKLASVTTSPSCHQKECRSRQRGNWSIASAPITTFRCWCCMISIRPASSSKTLWRMTPGVIPIWKRVHVIDLGLQYGDIGGLSPEPGNSNISSERLSEAGLSGAAIDFLRSQRVELNAMTSPQLVEFVERKLKQHGIKKVIPDEDTLKETYKAFVKSDRLSEAFDEMKEKFDDDDNDDPIEAPKNLGAQVKKKMKEQPDITWYRAIELASIPTRQ